ncbi:phage tail tape measure protein [Rhizobium laguerreae]|uniref:hypothetical protein n=1 Tax=Rhizobium laguerreae TaxID=1076926 RepID=UPI001C92929C|nr:hypothetical protein [Rhizobium laguerreae]MBY3363746.1 hypothetical protein [Rhizobium laguerreae]
MRQLASSFRDRMMQMRAAAAAAFKPILEGLKKIAAFSFSMLLKGANLAFRGIKIAALSAVAAITGIGAAAITSTKDLAELFNLVDKQSKALGISPEDVSVLRHAFEQNGVEADEVLPNLAQIGVEFKNVKDSIEDADNAWQKTKAWNLTEAKAAGLTGESVFAAYQSNNAAAATSFTGIDERQAQIRDQLERSRPDQDAYRRDLVKEFKTLDTAREALKSSMGPVGQALFQLQDAGLDMNRAMQPGIEGFYAVADAFQRVSDPTEKLQISMALFGEDAGGKMVPVLEKGRAGIEAYRKQLERLGGTVTARDAELADQYNESVRNHQTAIQGARREVFRAVAPEMIEANKQFTEFLVSNREKIAAVFRETFLKTKEFVLDVIAFIGGQRIGFRTDWLNSLVGGLRYVNSVVVDLYGEMQKLFRGEDTRFEWLNAIRDGLAEIGRFATEAFAVLRGGYSENYEFLNQARRQFDQFAARFKEAWDIFKGILDTIHQMLKPVFDLLGLDPTTGLLLLGMLRLSGILGGITTVIGGLLTGFTRLFAAGAGGGALTGALGGIISKLGILGGVLGGVALAGKALLDYSETSSDRVLNKQVELMRAQAEPQLQARERWKWNNVEQYRVDTMNKKYGTNIMSAQDRADNSGGIIDVLGDYGPAGAYIPGKRVAELGIFGGARLGGRTDEVEPSAPAKTYTIKLEAGTKSANLTGDQTSLDFISDLARQQRMGR